MHPYVHAFTPAIDPPWEAKSDFDFFTLLARDLDAGQGSAWIRSDRWRS